MDSEPLQYIEAENNNTLTDLLQNHNSEDEFDDYTLNFDKHSPYYDHKFFLTFLQDNDKSFTVLSINVASLISKYDEIEIFINEVLQCCQPLSAICIQETWLNKHDDISLFNLNCYNCISKGKTCSQRAGLVKYLSDNFNYNIIKCPEISTLWECKVIEITSNMLSRKVI